MTVKEHSWATIERYFLKIAFLNFLNIEKDYYKPEQYHGKPPTENATVSFREPASFLWKHFYPFKSTWVFWKV